MKNLDMGTKGRPDTKKNWSAVRGPQNKQHSTSKRLKPRLSEHLIHLID
jgi:hypothetical protein